MSRREGKERGVCENGMGRWRWMVDVDTQSVFRDPGMKMSFSNVVWL